MLAKKRTLRWSSSGPAAMIWPGVPPGGGAVSTNRWFPPPSSASGHHSAAVYTLRTCPQREQLSVRRKQTEHGVMVCSQNEDLQDLMRLSWHPCA